MIALTGVLRASSPAATTYMRTEEVSNVVVSLELKEKFWRTCCCQDPSVSRLARSRKEAVDFSQSSFSL